MTTDVKQYSKPQLRLERILNEFTRRWK